MISDNRLKENYGYYVDYNSNPAGKDVINDRVGLKKWVSKTDLTIVDMTSEEQQRLFSSLVVENMDPMISIEEENIGKYFFHPTKSNFHFFYTYNGVIWGEDKNMINSIDKWEFVYPNGNGKGTVYEINDFPHSTNNLESIIRENDKYSKFYDALQKAGLFGSLKLDWLNNKRCIVFAPTDEAWDESILPTDSELLVEYLKSCFISVEDNKLSNYILPQYGTPGEYTTFGSKANNTKTKIKILFADDKRLKVQTSTGEQALTDGDVPDFTTNGLIYGLSTMIIP